jgi:hypothetical protein
MRGRPKALPNVHLRGAIAGALAAAAALPAAMFNFGQEMGNAQLFGRTLRRDAPAVVRYRYRSKGPRAKRAKHRGKRKPRAWRRARVLKLRARRR